VSVCELDRRDATKGESGGRTRELVVRILLFFCVSARRRRLKSRLDFSDIRPAASTEALLEQVSCSQKENGSLKPKLVMITAKQRQGPWHTKLRYSYLLSEWLCFPS